MECAEPSCRKHPPNTTLYIVHYKIRNGEMIGIAHFCLEHLPEQETILQTRIKEYNEKQILKWQ